MTTLTMLRAKQLIVQNPDGTLRCPLSPSRKKQSYVYKDLLQHATVVAVGGKRGPVAVGGKRGPEAVGRHCGLKKFLECELRSLASPPVQRLQRVQHAAPRRQETDEMLVCPWSVVLCNIIHDSVQPTGGESIEVGTLCTRFKGEFVDLISESGCGNPLGIGLLQFGREFSGLKNAQALDKLFSNKEHGRKHYLKNSPSQNLEIGLYGWLARKEDFTGQPGGWPGAETVSRFLLLHCTLTDIGKLEADMKRIHDQEVQELAYTVSEKNEESLDLRTEIEIIRRRSADESLQMEESFRLGRNGDDKNQARQSEESYNQALLDRSRALQEKEKDLLRREKALQESYCGPSKSDLEAQKMERAMISRQQELQKQLQVGKMRLVQKHEEENKKIIGEAHNLTLMLANKQKMELEKQQLLGIIETQKLFGQLTVNSSDNREERKKIEELEAKLEELECNKEYIAGTLNSLMLKDRASTDEIVDARKLAAVVLGQHAEVADLIEAALIRRKGIEATLAKQEELEVLKDPPFVKLKSVGSIDERPWLPAYLKRYKHVYKHDYKLQMKAAEELSRWGNLLMKPTFRPFKNVPIGDDKWQQIIDPHNEKLAALRKELGEEVYKSVTTALMEIEEYNPSGRYPIPIPWVFEESRRATLKGVIAHLGAVVEALTITDQARKTPRN